MIYEWKSLIPHEANISDEWVFRGLVRDIISDMSLDDLSKIFKLTKIDPFAPDFKILDTSLADDLYELKSRNLILYKALINIP